MAPATACVATVRRIGQSLTGLFPFGLATVALFTGLIVVGSRNAPGGYDGGSLDVAFLVFAKMWMLGFLFRCIWPTSRAAAAAEALALFLAVCLLSSLVAEVLRWVAATTSIRRWRRSTGHWCRSSNGAIWRSAWRITPN